jgi:hypothetical protein
LGDIRDIFEGCSIALASEEPREVISEAWGNLNAWRFTEDETTCDDTKRQVPHQPADDGVLGSEDLD